MLLSARHYHDGIPTNLWAYILDMFGRLFQHNSTGLELSCPSLKPDQQSANNLLWGDMCTLFPAVGILRLPSPILLGESSELVAKNPFWHLLLCWVFGGKTGEVCTQTRVSGLRLLL